LFYLAALFGIVALVAVVYGGVRIVRGSRARGIAMIAAGVLLFGGSVWIFLAEQERLDFDRQLKEQAGQPDILPYPDD
jgi:O-antigen ligase